MALNEAERDELIKRLNDFEDMLIRYQKIVQFLADFWSIPGPGDWDKFRKLRRDLQIAYGGLRSVIKAYGEPPIVEVEGGKRDAFDLSLNEARTTKETVTALDACITAVRMVIGNLGSLNRGFARVQDTGVTAPKAFIAHGGDSTARRKLCEFLDALKVIPIIAEKEPSESRSVDDHIDWCLAQSDCAIILATKGDIDGKTRKWIPRGNILIEIGKIQERFPRKTVYLLEEGATFPTNVSEKVWERFTHECMDRAFIKIAKELVAFRIIKAVKPSE